MDFERQALAMANLFAHGLFLIDVDEFLRPQTDDSVLPIAQRWLSDASVGAVALNWATYGSSHRTAAGEGLVIERFTRRAPKDFASNFHAKPFVRVASVAAPHNPHAVILGSGRYVRPTGADVAWDTARCDRGITVDVVWDALRVDHYAVKSREEFLNKRRRGLAQP